MPLSFPIAHNARAALDAETGARTIAEAREQAGANVTLVSEWLRPLPAERESVQGKAESGVARGFVQLYEDAKGRPVIAVTFWKPQAAAKAKAKAEPQTPAKTPAMAVEDHTDDLYFAKASSRTKLSLKGRKRKKALDPKQLDLFTGPDQQGAEHPDPDNPQVILVEEEGDGAAFGLAPEEAAPKG
jgi:hypothetical protein